MHFFVKKVDDLFSRRRQNTGRERQNKTNKAVRYGNIFIFIFCKAIGRDLSARTFDLARPGVVQPLVRRRATDINSKLFGMHRAKYDSTSAKVGSFKPSSVAFAILATWRLIGRSNKDARPVPGYI